MRNVMTCVLHGFKSRFQRELAAIISMLFHTVRTRISLLHTFQGTLKLRFTLRTWKFQDIEIYLRTQWNMELDRIENVY